jgi:hypothetical protein
MSWDTHSAGSEQSSQCELSLQPSVNFGMNLCYVFCVYACWTECQPEVPGLLDCGCCGGLS